MNADAMRGFLVGQFATWLATWAGREQPNKDDKRRAGEAADAAMAKLVPAAVPVQGSLL